VSAAPGAASGRTVHGLVVGSYRRHFAVRTDEGETLVCVLKGRRLALACGDRVCVARARGADVIEALLPRATLFYRSDLFREKLVAANVTQVVGVVAPDLAVDEELVHRWIVATQAERCRFVLAVNKADKPGFDALFDRLAPLDALGYPRVALAAKRDATPLVPWLRGQNTVLIGQSGMGKSTLLNAIVPLAAARTAEISDALESGRHTTTHSTLHALPASIGSGWIVDSPGARAFGLAHLAPAAIVEAFVELRPIALRCRFRDCRHDREPGCAIREAVESGAVAAHRVALMRALVSESEAARAPGRRGRSH
jgi:ribosome biogenesis GTPase